MKLAKLKLKNYRNCTDLELDFNADKVLIVGKNAQGKTNILESIYFLSALKSPRAATNLELINFDAQSVEIEAQLVKAGASVELGFTYTNEKHRALKVNGLKSTPKNFKSVLKTVLFSTSDLLLLRGNPSDRRSWLDRAISQVYPVYDERLSKYDKIRVQKNNFLREGMSDERLLDVLNEQLVIAGSNIIYLRKKFLAEIEKIAREKHSAISNGEELSIRYETLPPHPNPLPRGEGAVVDKAEPSLTNAGEGAINEIAAAFRAELDARKAEEFRRAQACVGPHRDDVAFFINGNEAVKFASQGQQRTIVLALKLSELDIITEKTGDEPVLLLDDVLAELDDIRQNFLLKSIGANTQTVITSVDTVLFEEEFLKGVRVYNVENGAMK